MNNIIYRSVTDNFSKTLVENIFINKFMPSADGDFVKVYLYGLKNSQHPDQPSLSNKELAKLLRVSESTILAAYEYWSSKGIVEILDDGHETTVTFLDISTKFSNDYLLKTNPDLFPAQFKDQERFRSLIAKAEEMLGGQILPVNFIKSLSIWIEDYAFDYECICFLLEYCLTTMDPDSYYNLNGKLNYLNKVAENWYVNDIRTINEAVAFTQEYKANNKILYMVLHELGLRRSPMRFDKDLVNKWVNEYHFNKEMIMEGIKRTKAPNISYLDKILTDWHIHNYKTVEDIKNAPKHIRNYKNEKDIPVSDESINAAQEIEYSIFETFRKKRNLNYNQ